jgi:hypothetical protein
VSKLNHGDKAIVHLIRDGRLIECSLTCEKTAFDTCYLSLDDKEKFNQWLGLKSL